MARDIPICAPEDVHVFFKANARGENDSANKLREQVFHFVGSRVILHESNPHHSHRAHGERWRDITSAFTHLLAQILPRDAKAAVLEVRGGRSNNHDFDLRYVDSRGHEGTIPLELKSGASIYDQPQFLSLYATNELVDGLTYPEFFYDEYVSRSTEFKRFSPPSRAEYLSLVFGTEYSRHQFFDSLYRSDKAPGDRVRKQARSRLVKESIDRYLREHALSGFRPEVLQSRLNDQLPKRFVSWNQTTKQFVVERFTAEGVRLVGTTELKGGRKGNQVNTAVFPIQNGSEIHALLRWKNHLGVLGPAWQIKLVPA